MSHKENTVMPGAINEGDLSHIKEAVCLQVEKVYDSCKEKDCIENLEVHGISHHLIKKAINVSCESVEVKNVIIDVEPLRYRPGYYTVTVTFVFKVCVELFFRNQPPKRKCGIAMFTKRVILFGSQGRVKIFKSKFRAGRPDIPHTPFLEQDNRPNGKVEVAEPICLGATLADECTGTTLSPFEIEIIKSIVGIVQANIAVAEQNASIVNSDNAEIEQDIDIDQNNIINIGGVSEPHRQLQVTIGLFSIIKLVRFVQVLVPSFGFCNPPTCVEVAEAEEACELFETIEFPTNAFFPPQIQDFPVAGENEGDHECGCHK